MRTAWIIGGSGDIGTSIALTLAKANINIALSYFQNANRAKETCYKISDLNNVRVVPVKCDITNKESILTAYNEVVESIGYPDILIHSAGTSSYGLVQDMTESDYHHLMNIHVKSSFLLTQIVLPHILKKRWGRLIFISSIWGEIGAANESLYSAAKGAQISFAKALAKELGSTGITVNTICPGAIESEMLYKDLSPSDLSILRNEIPMKCLGKPHEVALLVRYLSSEKASYITGQSIGINGGWHI